MRALLAHPVLRVAIATALLGATIDLVTSAQVPLPIGALSDYANVLDRHGRDRITANIASAEQRLGISISILASWENPYSTAQELAGAVFRVWGLESGKKLLVVFVRTGGRWNLGVTASPGLRQSAPGIEADLTSALRDLVDHARIEEAMVELFRQLDRRTTAVERPADTSWASRYSSIGRVLLVVSLLAGLALFAHKRICPRCGRVLRIDPQRARGGFGAAPNRVYFCRNCHFRRGRP